METQDYIIREYIESDLAGVLELWELHSGWGRPADEEYKKWMKTPFGDCIVLVAENNKKQIVGQLTFTPTEVFINGIVYKALKVSAPIIHTDFRTKNLLNQNSLIMQIFLEGYQVVHKEDIDWLYNFPAAGWAKILRNLHKFGLSPWNVKEYKCVEIIDKAGINTDHEIKILNIIPEELEFIWEKFKRLNISKAFFTRKLNWLKYKWGDDIISGIYNDKNEIRGYAVVRKKTGLVLDFLLLDTGEISSIFVKLKQLIDFQYSDNPDSNPGLKLMLTPFFTKYLSLDIIKPINFQFVFGLCALKQIKDFKNLDFDNWYVFPND